MVPGEPIYDFFQAWKRAAAETTSMRSWGLRQWFIASADALAVQGYDVALQRKFVARGYLLLRRLSR